MKREISVLLIGIMIVSILCAGCSQNSGVDDIPKDTTSQSEAGSEKDNTQNDSNSTEDVAVDYPTKDPTFMIADVWAPLQGGITQIIPIQTKGELFVGGKVLDADEYVVYVDGIAYKKEHSKKYEMYKIGKDKNIISALNWTNFITLDEDGNYTYYASNTALSTETELKYGDNPGRVEEVAYYTTTETVLGKLAGTPIERLALYQAENEVWYNYNWQKKPAMLVFNGQKVVEVYVYRRDLTGAYLCYFLTENGEFWNCHISDLELSGAEDDMQAEIEMSRLDNWKIDNVKRFFNKLSIGYVVAEVSDNKNLYCYPSEKQTPYKIALPEGYTNDDVVSVIIDGNTVVIELNGQQYYSFKTDACIMYDGSTPIGLTPIEDLNKYSKHIVETYYKSNEDTFYVLFDNGYLYEYRFK